jgi:hypothetical protein
MSVKGILPGRLWIPALEGASPVACGLSDWLTLDVVFTRLSRQQISFWK